MLNTDAAAATTATAALPGILWVCRLARAHDNDVDND